MFHHLMRGGFSFYVWVMVVDLHTLCSETKNAESGVHAGQKISLNMFQQQFCICGTLGSIFFENDNSALILIIDCRRTEGRKSYITSPIWSISRHACN